MSDADESAADPQHTNQPPPLPPRTATPPPTIRGLANRLKLPQPSARRIAIADLARRAATEPDALAALLAHLPRETDDNARLRIIRALGEHRYRPASSALTTVRDDPASSAEIAHAATLAFDRIERADLNPPTNS